MASLAVNMISKHVLKENASNRFGKEDPYFETYQATDSQGRPTGKTHKRKKAVPEGISPHDAKVLTKVKRRAYRLDNAINICGIKFGWSSIIGFIPGAGDIIDFFMAWMVISSAKKVSGGLDSDAERKMWLNVMIDFAIGLVPFLGDFADAFFRCNTKNAVVLEQMLIKRRNKALALSEKNADRIANSDDPRHNNLGDLPPAYNQSERMTVPKPVRTAGGHGGGRGWFSGRGEREQDVERGEVTTPIKPPRPAEAGRL